VPLPASWSWPSCGVPETVGGVQSTGARPSTASVAGELALFSPAQFDAVTVTRIVEPTSELVAAYVFAVAPPMSAQLPPLASQWRDRKRVVLGVVGPWALLVAVGVWRSWGVLERLCSLVFIGGIVAP